MFQPSEVNVVNGCARHTVNLQAESGSTWQTHAMIASFPTAYVTITARVFGKTSCVSVRRPRLGDLYNLIGQRSLATLCMYVHFIVLYRVYSSIPRDFRPTHGDVCTTYTACNFRFYLLPAVIGWAVLFFVLLS